MKFNIFYLNFSKVYETKMLFNRVKGGAKYGLHS